MQKVLIANRGEIAVRVIRACKDAGLASVAIYAEPDRDALHVRMADEAYALGGTTPGDSYLVIDKVIDAARQSGADAVHPGYGFLSENADFAQAVLDAGLTWIGPSPQSIRDLGDKVTARHIALAAGAPLVPGTADPVSGADEVLAFADEHGLPVAIKAAFGGGGRGLKIARSREEIPELYDSAVREAVAAFGRGECFVERYLDRSRHVEAQVLADQPRQRHRGRHPGLLATAPQPETRRGGAGAVPHRRAARAHPPRAPRRSAARPTITARAPSSTSSAPTASSASSRSTPGCRSSIRSPRRPAGIDLVREQFRIADGEPLELTEDPTPRGHSFEFRINGEDPGRNFLPAPGTVTTYREPAGPGVRVDSGIEANSVIGGAFDSLLAKLIVTGETRDEALARARRALDEFVVEGMATALPFHRAVVRDPAFAPTDGAPFTIFTQWIETEFDNQIAPYAGGAPSRRAGRAARDDRRRGRRQAPRGLAAGRLRRRRRRRLGQGGAEALGRHEVGVRGIRRLADRADAGHDRQGRRRRGRHGRGRRPRSSCSRR